MKNILALILIKILIQIRYTAYTIYKRTSTTWLSSFTVLLSVFQIRQLVNFLKAEI